LSVKDFSVFCCVLVIPTGVKRSGGISNQKHVVAPARAYE